MTSEASLTVQDLADAFRDVGLTCGDAVIVHSSFRSLGEVAGGPAAVIEALLAVIGAKGNLMLPTFNYTRPLPQPYYDPAETSARTGIIAETGRRWAGAVRSLHPTHSVAVIGPEAGALTCEHLACRAIGIGSPIDRLAKKGGKVLLIGVNNASNSMVHVGEEYAGTPKASWYDELPFIPVKMPDGSIRSHQLDTSPSCSLAFGGVEGPLRRKGAIRDVRLGGCKLQLMLGADVIETVCEMIVEKRDILLCTWARCKPCVGARKRLRTGR